MTTKIKNFINKWFGMIVQARTAAALAKYGNVDQAVKLISK